MSSDDIKRIPRIIRSPSSTGKEIEIPPSVDMARRINRGRRKTSQPYPPYKKPSLIPVAKPGSKLYFFIAQKASTSIEEGKSPILFPASEIQFEIRDEEKLLKAYIYKENEEVEAFSKFLQLVEEFKDIQIISYGGRNFFFPRLNIVAMRENLNAGNFFKAGDRYNNYMSRYSPYYHTDMMDSFTNYGSVQTPSLDDVYKYIIGDECDDTLKKVKALFERWDKWRG